MYLVIFDKSGRSLSGWHYSKLRKIGGLWIQKSSIAVTDARGAQEIVGELRKFGVQKISVFRAVDVTNST